MKDCPHRPPGPVAGVGPRIAPNTMGALTDCLGEGTHALPEVGYWAGQPPGCWYGPGCPG